MLNYLNTDKDIEYTVDNCETWERGKVQNTFWSVSYGHTFIIKDEITNQNYIIKKSNTRQVTNNDLESRQNLLFSILVLNTKSKIEMEITSIKDLSITLGCHPTTARKLIKKLQTASNEISYLQFNLKYVK